MSAAGLAAPPRPCPPRALPALLAFQGASAVLGGAMMVAQPRGAATWFPDAWLDGVPFSTWLGPGLILGVGLGVSALVLALGVRRRPAWPPLTLVTRWTGHHWSWAGALALGTGLMAWIVVQRLVIPDPSWLQPLYFGVGAGVVALASLPATRRWLRAEP